jgi:hypothetical protein
MELIILNIAFLALLAYSILFFYQINMIINFIGLTKWIALSTCILFYCIGLCGFIFFITILSRILINFYHISSERKKRKRNVKYESYLEEVADINLIFNYFIKIQKRLPENLHNIMMSYALSKNPDAIKYVSSIDTKTGNVKPSTFKDQIIFDQPIQTCLTR